MSRLALYTERGLGTENYLFSLFCLKNYFVWGTPSSRFPVVDLKVPILCVKSGNTVGAIMNHFLYFKREMLLFKGTYSFSDAPLLTYQTPYWHIRGSLSLCAHTVSFSLAFYILLRPQGIRKQTRRLLRRLLGLLGIGVCNCKHCERIYNQDTCQLATF